jgi:hypothetical protein
MKIRSAQLFGFVLALMAGTVVFAEDHFNSKNNVFNQPGEAQREMMYTFIVPEGITIKTKSGKVITGGEKIGIPGVYLTLLDPMLEFHVVDKYGQHFANKNQYEALPPTQKRDYALISLKIPEGVTVTKANGEVEKGPQDIMLMVKAAEWGMMPAKLPTDLVHPDDMSHYVH